MGNLLNKEKQNSNKLNLYMVYWRGKTRKCMPCVRNEKEAIEYAKRFAGIHVKDFIVEKLN